ncbi:unnamed protein product [Ixodes hexagonus]
MVQRVAWYALGVSIIAAATTTVSCITEHDFDNGFDDKFFGSLIKTKDSRTFLSDLINKIQLLLNDTVEPSSTPKLIKSTPKVIRSGRRRSSAGSPTRVVPTKLGTRTSSSKLASGMSSSNTSSTAGGTRGTIGGIADWDVAVQTNRSLLMSNDTVVDVEAEQELKKMVNQDSNQRVATLGVIICLTFVGTATCIVVMALYSSKFSGIILLSNGRWWCPMVTRGNGVERQLGEVKRERTTQTSVRSNTMLPERLLIL